MKPKAEITEVQWIETLWKLSRKERKFYHRLMEMRMELVQKQALLANQVSSFVEQMVLKYILGDTLAKKEENEKD